MKNLDKQLYNKHSIYIRLKRSDEYGNMHCYTCGAHLTFKTAQCGHYPLISRNNMRFAWDTEIHKPQCSSCNCFKQGEENIFRDKLINELGFERLSKIEFESRTNFKWFEHDKKELLKWFRDQNRKLYKDKMF